MKKHKLMHQDDTRRSFLFKGIFAGSALLFGVNQAKAEIEQTPKTKKLITADGQLVEVEEKYLPDRTRKKISKMEVLEWKYEQRNKSTS